MHAADDFLQHLAQLRLQPTNQPTIESIALGGQKQGIEEFLGEITLIGLAEIVTLERIAPGTSRGMPVVASHLQGGSTKVSMPVGMLVVGVAWPPGPPRSRVPVTTPPGPPATWTWQKARPGARVRPRVTSALPFDTPG